MPEAPAKDPAGVHRRIYYGPFRVWDGNCKWPMGRAHLNLLSRNRWQLNVNVEMFSRGRYPHFKSKDRVWQGTLILPLPVCKDVLSLLERKGIRIQKTADHTWRRKRFKSEVGG